LSCAIGIGRQSANVLAINPTRQLTEEAARQAILKLGKYKNSPIVFVSADRGLTPGCWYCDLKHEAFWINVREDRWHIRIGGKFERDKGQTWKARIIFDQGLLPPLGPLGKP
jgi:hypothetical protein